MIEGVAVQHAAAQLLQRPQSAGLACTGGAGDAHHQRAGRFDHMEARRLFQPVADGQTQPALVGALGEDLRHVGVIEGAQRVEHMPGMGQLVGGRAETVDDMSFK